MSSIRVRWRLMDIEHVFRQKDKSCKSFLNSKEARHMLFDFGIDWKRASADLRGGFSRV